MAPLPGLPAARMAPSRPRTAASYKSRNVGDGPERNSGGFGGVRAGRRKTADWLRQYQGPYKDREFHSRFRSSEPGPAPPAVVMQSLSPLIRIVRPGDGFRVQPTERHNICPQTNLRQART